MSDQIPQATQAPQAASLSQQILQAPEPIWARIRAALKVATREEAVQLVQTDPSVAATVLAILGGGEQGSLVTAGKPQQGGGPASLVAGGPIPTAPLAERIYPSKRKSRGRVEF